MITAKTKLLGVIGHPIVHSMSPAMHNASFTTDGLDYAYVALDVAPGELPEAVAGLRALGFEGFNVTMPHKEKVISLLDTLDQTAEISGAVNTVKIQDGALRGMNTDGSGFVRACDEAGIDFKNKRVLLLGAGGAGAAVAAAVLKEKARELVIANRTPSRAHGLETKLEGAKLDRKEGGAEISTCPFNNLGETVAQADVIINTTYLGMEKKDLLPVPVENLNSEKVVCDVVYLGDRDTELLRKAREVGARVVSGERMLLYQGVEAQRMWTGREPNVEAMSDALLR